MKKYTKQYRTEITRDKNNKKVHSIIYTGDYYEVKKEIRKREWFLLFSILFMALHFLAGILNTPSSRVFYVTLPYVILFFPGVYFLMGAFTFYRAPKKMEFPTYEKSVVRMRRSLRGLFWGLSYLLSAETIFLTLSVYQNGLEKEEFFREAVFLIICGVNFVQIFRNKKNVDGMETVVSQSSKT